MSTAGPTDGIDLDIDELRRRMNTAVAELVPGAEILNDRHLTGWGMRAHLAEYIQAAALALVSMGRPDMLIRCRRHVAVGAINRDQCQGITPTDVIKHGIYDCEVP